MKQNNNKRKIYRIFAFLLAVLITFGTVGISEAYADTRVALKKYYTQGQTLDIKSALPENTEQFRVWTPEGDCLVSDSIVLDESGVYTVTYHCTGENEQTETFCVAEKMFSTTKGSTAYYDSEQNGIVVTLKKDGVFSYNRPISFKNMDFEKLISFYCTPKKNGSPDMEQVIIRLTDWFDENNYVEIHIQAVDSSVTSPTAWSTGTSYVRAGSNLQPKCGLEGNTWHINGKWGVAQSISMYGLSPDDPRQHTFSISLDYDTRTVYAGDKYVADLDDALRFSTLWNGFSADQCRLSIYMDRYIQSTGTIVITDIASLMLFDESYVLDTAEPNIAIDFGANTANNLPSAILNLPYRVFDFAVSDNMDGNVQSSVRVYRDYYSSTRTDIPVTEGAFVPKTMETHYIVYSATDAFDNQATQVLPIKVQEQSQLGISVKNEKETADIGTFVPLQKYTVQNENGYTTVDAVVTDSQGKEVAVLDNAFLPESIGNYTVKYIASDYVSRVETSYTVEVKPANTIRFGSDVELPKYMIANTAYTLPQVYATSYASGKPEQVRATVSVNGNGVELDGQKVTFEKEGFYHIVYAVDYDGEQTSVSYQVQVVNTSKDGKLDISNYFVGTGIQKETTKDGLLVSAQNGNGELEFIKSVLAELDIELGFIPEKANFQKLIISVRDAQDSQIGFDICLEQKSPTETYCYIEGESTKNVINAGFSNTNTEVMLSYDQSTMVLTVNNGLKLKLSELQKNQAFSGFPSGKVSLSFAMENCRSNAAVVLRKINRQTMGNVALDLQGPTIWTNLNIDLNADINEVITVGAAYVEDVLNPESNITVTVTAPDGTVVTTVSGEKLDKADPSVSYEFIADQYGSYKVSLDATDGVGKTSAMSYVFHVADKVKPEFKLEGTMPTTGTVGKKIVLPGYTVSDNVTPQEDIHSLICVISSDQLITEYNAENGIVPTRAGMYVVLYYGVDADGNCTTERFVIEVTED